MDRRGITFDEISHGSAEWRAVLEHRDRILRQPLGLSLSADDITTEESQRHFVLREGGEIIAGLITRPPRDGKIQIRQMWVHESHQGNGVGRRLLSEVAQVFATEGIAILTLHARETARGFYIKCGYQPNGEAFTEIAIPHILMVHESNPPASH